MGPHIRLVGIWIVRSVSVSAYVLLPRTQRKYYLPSFTILFTFISTISQSIERSFFYFQLIEAIVKVPDLFHSTSDILQYFLFRQMPIYHIIGVLRLKSNCFSPINHPPANRL